MLMDLGRYLNNCLWWNGRRVWVSAPADCVPRFLGEIVRVAPGQSAGADVDLTVLLLEGAVINVRASEKGKLWDFE
jgi:hypothetical protein